MRSLIPAFLIITTFFVCACTKIDSTVLGGGLIPAVDNINTFDTIMDVVTTNMVQNDDSTILSSSDLLAVGSTNDPLFGQSAASLYFEFKPSNFSALSAGAISRPLKDSFIGYDSTVLCLRYAGGFGDTALDIRFDVYMLNEKFKDTAFYKIKDVPPATGLLVGSKSVSLRSLIKDSVRVYRSTASNYKTIRELRIPLDPLKYDWLNTLLRDSIKLASDSAYRTVFKGFAIKAQVMSITGSMAYFNIRDTASKLEFYYRRKNNGADTTHFAFSFNPNNSGFADNVTWTAGGEISSHLSPTVPDPYAYIKTTPGTATRIRIPGLQNLSNRIIHRAELKMYQVPFNTITDGYLVVPPLLYLERFDSANSSNGQNKYLSIPIDLSPNTAYGDCFPPGTTGIDYAYFGGFPKLETVNSLATNAYTFNISRYVQQVITKRLRNADLRLSSNLYSKYDSCGSMAGPIRVTSNPIGYGRVRLGGGMTTGSNLPYKMRLRIIYSKL